METKSLSVFGFAMIIAGTLFCTQQNESGLQQRVQELETALQSKTELTIVDSNNWDNFVSYAATDYDAGSDFAYEAKDIVPQSAKGLILKVLIKGANDAPELNRYTSVITADPDGKFASNVSHYSQNGFSNYNTNWTGGTVFAPFKKGGRQIKLRATSNAKPERKPDSTVLLIVTCVGYY